MNLARVQIPTSVKLNMLSNLVTMMKAGIPIVTVVETLLQEAKGGEKTILTQVHDDLTAGKNLADAFGLFPKVFDTVVVNLVRVAEQSGTLELTLADLVKTVRKDIEFMDKVKGALFYPAIVVVVFTGVFVMILTVVMPKISQVFMRMNIDLPLPTRLMIASSELLITRWPFIVAGLVVLVVLLFLLFKTQRQWFVRTLLSIPGISALSRQIDITRFSRSLHLLLTSGVPITEALSLAGGVVYTTQVKRVIDKGLESATSGLPFSVGLRAKHSPFPAMMTKLIEVGEQTGTLDKAMQDVSEHMEYQVEKTLAKLAMMLEPIMLVLVGIAVGGMMMSIIGPIYGMIGQVGAR